MINFVSIVLYDRVALFSDFQCKDRCICSNIVLAKQQIFEGTNANRNISWREPKNAGPYVLRNSTYGGGGIFCGNFTSYLHCQFGVFFSNRI